MNYAYYAKQICDAIEVITDKKIADCGYDKTIKGQITKVVDKNTGEYIIQYQDSSFSAFSVNGADLSGYIGTYAYVLIPTNNFNLKKIILRLEKQNSPINENTSVINNTSTYNPTNVNINFKVVDSLPTSNIDPTTIYLVPKSSTEEKDKYDEYIYVNGVWEKLGGGGGSADLSNYVKFTDYASDSKAGVVKVNPSTYGIGIASSGTLMGATVQDSFFEDKDDKFVISKGTLKNRLANYVKNTDYATDTTPGLIQTGNGLKINSEGIVCCDATNAYNGTDGQSDDFVSMGALKKLLCTSFNEGERTNTQTPTTAALNARLDNYVKKEALDNYSQKETGELNLTKGGNPSMDPYYDVTGSYSVSGDIVMVEGQIIFHGISSFQDGSIVLKGLPYVAKESNIFISRLYSLTSTNVIQKTNLDCFLGLNNNATYITIKNTSTNFDEEEKIPFRFSYIKE